MASLFEERKSLRPGVSPCECFVCRAHIVSISLPSHASRGPPPANLGAVSRQMPSCCSATASRRPRGLCLVTQQHVKMDWQRHGHAGATMVRGQSHRGHWRAVFAASSHCTASCAGASLHTTSPSLPRCHARGRYVALGVPLLCFSTTSPHMQRHSALVVSFRLKSVGGTIVICFSLEDRVRRFGIGFAWPESCAG
jgi:hypothetical protein